MKSVRTILLATSALSVLTFAHSAWAQSGPAPAPGGPIQSDTLCSEIIDAPPEFVRDAANFLTAYLSSSQAGGAPTAGGQLIVPAQAPSAPAGQEDPATAAGPQTSPDVGGDPSQQADQSAGPTPSEPQGSGGNNAGGASAESAADAPAPAEDGTITTGAGNFAAPPSGAGNPAAPAGAAPADPAQAVLTPEQLLEACRASPSAQVISVLPDPASGQIGNPGAPAPAAAPIEFD